MSALTLQDPIKQKKAAVKSKLLRKVYRVCWPNNNVKNATRTSFVPIVATLAAFKSFQCYRESACGPAKKGTLPTEHSASHGRCRTRARYAPQHQLIRKRIHMSRYFFLPTRDGTKCQVRFVHVSVLTFLLQGQRV